MASLLALFSVAKKRIYLGTFLGLKPLLIQVVLLLSLWIKLTIDQLLLFFLCSSSSFLSYFGGILVTDHFSLLFVDRYILVNSANYNTQGAFAILFLICSDLLNCLRSLGTMVITFFPFLFTIVKLSNQSITLPQLK